MLPRWLSGLMGTTGLSTGDCLPGWISRDDIECVYTALDTVSALVLCVGVIQAFCKGDRGLVAGIYILVSI